jgi:predicted DNA binding CopG/RHH family protein
VLFESSALDIGAKVNESMTEKIRYTDEPMGDLKVVPDFLPSPEELAFREEGVKVTIALSKRSIEFFKREAAKHGTQYQRMIRRLLDTYARHHSRPLTTRSTRVRGKSSRAG